MGLSVKSGTLISHIHPWNNRKFLFICENLYTQPQIDSSERIKKVYNHSRQPTAGIFVDGEE